MARQWRDLLDRLRALLPERAPKMHCSGIAVSVNAEYAQAAQILHDGDEVGLLPPVSGGAARDAARTAMDAFWTRARQPNVLVALTRERDRRGQDCCRGQGGEDGAVVVFDGIVRNHSRGRRTLYLDYEAYEEMARKTDAGAGREGARTIRRAPGDDGSPAGAAGDWRDQRADRGGSAHRSAAFEACRWLIDTVKQTVPIWKKETFADGAVWAPGEPFPEGLAVDVAEAPHEG